MSISVIAFRDNTETEQGPIRYEHKFVAVLVRDIQAGTEQKIVQVFPKWWEHSGQVEDILRRNKGAPDDFLGAGKVIPRNPSWGHKTNILSYDSETCESRFGREQPRDLVVAQQLLQDIRAALEKEGLLIPEGQPLPPEPTISFDDDSPIS